MMEKFNMMTEEEKQEMERNWNISIDSVKKLAEKYDAQQALLQVRPEDIRKRQDDKMLNQFSMDDVLEVYQSGVKNMTKEFQTDDPYALQKDRLVKIAPKSKKQSRQAKKMAKENEEQIKALFSDPENIQIEKAAELAKKSSLRAKDVTDRDMARLRRLRNKALEELGTTGDSAVTIETIVTPGSQ